MVKVVTAQRDGGGNVVASDDDAHDANLEFLDCKNEISASYTIMMLTMLMMRRGHDDGNDHGDHH